MGRSGRQTGSTITSSHHLSGGVGGGGCGALAAPIKLAKPNMRTEVENKNRVDHCRGPAPALDDSAFSPAPSVGDNLFGSTPLVD